MRSGKFAPEVTKASRRGFRLITLLVLALLTAPAIVSFNDVATAQTGFETLESAVEHEALIALGYTPDSAISIQIFREQDNWVYGAYVYPALHTPESNIAEAESALFIAVYENEQWKASHIFTDLFRQMIMQTPQGLLTEQELNILSPDAHSTSYDPNAISADGSSQLALPWDPYTSGWRLNQGPHAYNGSPSYGFSSLDLNGPTGVHMVVRAAREGIAYQVDCATPSTLVVITHADGWATKYLHLENIQIPAYTSYPVSRWQWLGNTGFVGTDGCGTADGVHLHFSLWKDNAEYNLNNVAIGGYVVNTTTKCLTHPIFGTKCQWDGLPNDGTIGEYPPVCTSSTSLLGPLATTNSCENVEIWDQANSGGNITWSGNVGFSNDPGGNQLQYRLVIPQGMSVKTWRGDNRTGEERCWSMTVPNLQDHGWQNDIESIEVFGSNVCPQPPPTQCGPDVGPDVKLFEHNNCDGSSITFPNAGMYNLSNFNDMTSSVHVPSGKSVALFEHNDGGGQNRCIPENADLWDMSHDYWPNGSSMNDSVSSVRVFGTPDCEPYIITAAPAGWCQGGVGWEHKPYDIPQDPGCSFGVYASDIDGNVVHHTTFQAMTDRLKGKWGGMWFEPSCSVQYVPLGKVAIFNNVSCSGSYTQYNAGTYNMTSKEIRSVFIPTGKSVALIKSGGSQSLCRGEGDSMWDLRQDHWPDGSDVYGTVGSMKVFDSADCEPYIITTAPTGWCQGGIGWEHKPYDIPQDPGCSFGVYASDIDGNVVKHDTFQEMVNRLEGGWGGMWFEPSCSVQHVPLDQVAIFDGANCGGNYTEYAAGTYNMTGKVILSVFIPMGKSVALIKNDGKQTFCRGEDQSLWNLHQDHWPDGSVVYGTVGGIKVFNSSTCGSYIITTAPPGWCQGGIGWKHDPYDIPQDPGCLFGEYGSNIDGDVVMHATFQGMLDRLEGKWGSMWFEPSCSVQHVPLDQVAVFDNVSCSGSYTQYNAGTYDMTGKDMVSVFVPMGRSVLLAKADDQQIICRYEDQSMWDLHQDHWPDGSGVYGTVSSIKVYNNPSCKVMEFDSKIFVPFVIR